MNSKEKYDQLSEKDVWVTTRERTRICVDICRPDAPGKFPALVGGFGPYQKDLNYLPWKSPFDHSKVPAPVFFVPRG